VNDSRVDGAPERGTILIPVAVSVRHVHLTQTSIDRLFGSGHRLRVHLPLTQPGQYAAEETVDLVGPRGRLAHVRIVGPPRAEDQVEISRSDEYALGVDAPVRESGDLHDTPGIRLEGPAGAVVLERGVVCALRHLHCSPADAVVLGLNDHDSVAIAIESQDRRLVFGDVRVRISPQYRLELHVDTDEGNAAEVRPGDAGILVSPPQPL
jgi:acetate kinase